ncbi:MAG: 4-(cytidine 5'-diphospho)-2-C-methyl-D-erythritol kinase [Sulfitobacter sp.]|nr:4-(cytidine 5'-diphospho)-2-C-methyl-D-erythritol kinase [Sulfitobacter sp.]
MTSDSARLEAPAKINLTLHVTGRRPDGYHLLDSLVVFADLGDVIDMTGGANLSLTVSGPFASGVPTDQRNLVWRAAEAAGLTGAIKLQKNLPHGAGIGGGSSDAAAILRHAGRPDLAPGLGADVPVCLRPEAQRMTGIGAELTALVGLPAFPAVLVNPGAHLPTPAVFQALERPDNAPMTKLPGEDQDLTGWLDWLALQRNDLEAAARHLAPVVGEVLATLQAQKGARVVRMSGSGSTCFALFEQASQATAAAKWIGNAQDDWWVRAVTCNPNGPRRVGVS